jgi:hypothetical protein
VKEEQFYCPRVLTSVRISSSNTKAKAKMRKGEFGMKMQKCVRAIDAM